VTSAANGRRTRGSRTRIGDVVRVVAFMLASSLLGLPCVATAATAMVDTIARVKPSIVAIGTYQKTRSPAFVFRGTGFAVGDGTVIATNAHVLPDQLATQERETLVVLIVGRGEPQPREAVTLAVDGAHDLALLRISGSALPALAVGLDTVREGDTLAFTGFPIGNVLGFFAPVTHRAMVSAVTPVALPSGTAKQLDARVVRRVRSGVFPVLQLDATAYPGNSGSPLYDIETGRVVGIINMVFVKGTRESALSQPSGITFAVPVRHLEELLATAQSPAANR
jgi:S1-C subfamily serine protease